MFSQCSYELYEIRMLSNLRQLLGCLLFAILQAAIYLSAQKLLFPLPTIVGNVFLPGSARCVSEAVLWCSSEACFCKVASKHNPERASDPRNVFFLFGFEVLSPLFQNAIGSIYIPKLFCLEQRELRKSGEATHINNCV